MQATILAFRKVFFARASERASERAIAIAFARSRATRKVAGYRTGGFLYRVNSALSGALGSASGVIDDAEDERIGRDTYNAPTSGMARQRYVSSRSSAIARPSIESPRFARSRVASERSRSEAPARREGPDDPVDFRGSAGAQRRRGNWGESEECRIGSSGGPGPAAPRLIERDLG